MKQRARVAECLADWSYGTDGRLTAIESDRVIELIQLVLALPNCADLSERDALTIIYWYAFSVKEAGKGRLGDQGNEAALASAADGFCAELESLPRSYRFTVPLPSFPTWGPGRIDLSPDVSLVWRDVGPPKGLLAGLTISEAPAELEVRAAGYAFGGNRTATLLHAYSQMKRVAFVLRSHRSFYLTWGPDRAMQVQVEDVARGTRDEHAAPHSISEALATLAVRTAGLTLPAGESKNQLMTLLGKPPATNAERIAALDGELKLVKARLMDAAAPDFARAFTAAEWYIDSIGTEDSTLAYLMACIGIEAIFNDAEQMMSEMTQRLADRYSFMFGETGAERQALKSTFDAVFKQRGQLIHARQPRLHGRDLRLLMDAQKILERSIARELRLDRSISA